MKGKHITLLIENILPGGIIESRNLSAKVITVSGNYLTVKDEDGYLHEVERYDRNEDGNYVVTIR
jgi:hypothetical protein